MGRKKLGNVLFARRVPPSLVNGVDMYVGAAIEAKRKGDLKAVEAWFLKTYGVDIGRASMKEVEGLVKAESVPVWENKPFAEDNLKALEPHATNQVKLLLDDIEAKTKEVEVWKSKFEKAVGATPDQISAYWKRECLKYKAELEKLGDLSQ